MALSLEDFTDVIGKIRGEIGKVIVGYDEIIDLILISLLSGGHVLLEGVPGIGKTLIVKTLSEIIDLKFSRVQFTPDLMPADITGTNIILEDEEVENILSFKKDLYLLILF